MAPRHSWKRGWPWPKTNNNKMEKEGEFKVKMDESTQSIIPSFQPLFSEHFLSPDKLADIFPLARIDPQNLLASRGISQVPPHLIHSLIYFFRRKRDFVWPKIVNLAVASQLYLFTNLCFPIFTLFSILFDFPSSFVPFFSFSFLQSFQMPFSPLPQF